MAGQRGEWTIGGNQPARFEPCETTGNRSPVRGRGFHIHGADQIPGSGHVANVIFYGAPTDARPPLWFALEIFECAQNVFLQLAKSPAHHNPYRLTFKAFENNINRYVEVLQ